MAALPEDLCDGGGERGPLLGSARLVGVSGRRHVTQPGAEQQRLHHVRLQGGQHPARSALEERTRRAACEMVTIRAAAEHILTRLFVDKAITTDFVVEIDTDLSTLCSVSDTA